MEKCERKAPPRVVGSGRRRVVAFMWRPTGRSSHDNPGNTVYAGVHGFCLRSPDIVGIYLHQTLISSGMRAACRMPQ